MTPSEILLNITLDVSENLGFLECSKHKLDSTCQTSDVFPEITLRHRTNTLSIAFRLISVFDDLCIVHGRSMKNNSNEYQSIILRLNPFDFIKEIIHSKVRNKEIIGDWMVSTNALSARLKSAFFFPLCFPDSQSPHLTYLPSHLLIQILQNNQVNECAALEATCRDLRELSSETDCLWDNLLMRDFQLTTKPPTTVTKAGTATTATAVITAKETYRLQYIARKERARGRGVGGPSGWSWQPIVLPPPEHTLRFHPQRGPMLPFPSRPTIAELVPPFEDIGGAGGRRFSFMHPSSHL